MTREGSDEFARLYEQLLPLARVVAPSGIDGADVLQEALTRVLARHPHLDGLREPRAYLSRAIVNVARTWGRRRGRELPSSAASAATSATVEPDSDLRDLLAHLAPRQRACLYLRFVEDLSVETTAAQLGCTTGTVKSQTAKALATLRTVLEHEAEEVP